MFVSYAKYLTSPPDPLTAQFITEEGDLDLDIGNHVGGRVRIPLLGWRRGWSPWNRTRCA
ncbi:MAG: hypothetical protein Kow0063_05050 [Anaerolineae bacterium]